MEVHTTQLFGAWGLIAVGLFVLVRASFTTRSGERAPYVAWVFGLAAAGVGTYGPAFLKPYSEFLEPFIALQREPSEANYEEFLKKAANDELPLAIQELGVAYMVDHPIEGLDKDFARVAPAAKTQATKDLFHKAQKQVAAADAKADAILAESGGHVGRDSMLLIPDAQKFELPTLFLLEQKLKRLPARDLEADSIPGPGPGKEPQAEILEKPILVDPKVLEGLKGFDHKQIPLKPGFGEAGFPR